MYPTPGTDDFSDDMSGGCVRDDYRALVDQTVTRAYDALNSLEAGQDADTAVLASGLLRLYSQVEGDPHGDQLVEPAPPTSVGAVLGAMLECCEYREPDVQLVLELVHQYHRLVELVPAADWHQRMADAARKVAADEVLSSRLAAARASAAARLGSPYRVDDVLRRWRPDHDEQVRLVRLVGQGREADAVLQALEQAVFSAELDGM